MDSSIVYLGSFAVSAVFLVVLLWKIYRCIDKENAIKFEEWDRI